VHRQPDAVAGAMHKRVGEAGFGRCWTEYRCATSCTAGPPPT